MNKKKSNAWKRLISFILHRQHPFKRLIRKKRISRNEQTRFRSVIHSGGLTEKRANIFKLKRRSEMFKGLVSTFVFIHRIIRLRRFIQRRKFGRNARRRIDLRKIFRSLILKGQNIQFEFEFEKRI